MLYTVGHKNPDTDSVVSAIILAKLMGATPAVSGKINKETEYVLNKFGFETPQLLPEGDKEVILVDHNSPDEMVESIKSHEIKGIFDHHRLGGVFSSDPIPVRIETLGSTGSIIAKTVFEENKEISQEDAGMLISCIISDTLKFTSPTSTDEDRELANRLNEIANIDIDQLADEMFKAKSDISDISTEELVNKDYKVFEMNGRKVGFGVWETVSPETVLERKDAILENLDLKKKREALFNIFFAVVDIMNNSSELILLSSYEEEVAKEVFKGDHQDQIMHLPGVCSRKKQMVPPLEAYFQSYLEKIS